MEQLKINSLVDISRANRNTETKSKEVKYKYSNGFQMVNRIIPVVYMRFRDEVLCRCLVLFGKSFVENVWFVF